MMKSRKICCVFNYNPLYRLPIYKEMDKQLDCHFFFGDSVFQPLAQFDPHELKGFQHFIHTKRSTSIFTKAWGSKYHTNIKSIFSKKYTDYIITGEIYLTNWLILLYSKLTNKRVYVWTHGYMNEPEPGNHKLLYWLNTKFFYPKMDGLLLYNSFVKDNMIKYGCKAERLHVINNSLDTHQQTELYNKLSPSDIYKKHFGNNNPTVIFIGRLQQRMKIDMLIDAVNDLNKEGYATNLVLVGKYMDGPDYKQQVENLNLSNQVWFYGPSFDESVNSELLYNADVCVCPGSIGLTCIHALSYGTPVITHGNFAKQMPEFEAIEEGVTGSFFEEGNIISLVHNIKRWTNLSHSKREQIRLAARRGVEERWNVDYQIKLLRRLFYDNKE